MDMDVANRLPGNFANIYSDVVSLRGESSLNVLLKNVNQIPHSLFFFLAQFEEIGLMTTGKNERMARIKRKCVWYCDG